jgi:membrane protease YdiL (CAAX protease family)
MLEEETGTEPDSSESSEFTAGRDFDLGPADGPNPRQVVLLAVLFEGGLALVALGLGYLCDFDVLRTFAWTVKGVWIGLLGTVPVVVGLIVLDRFPIGPFAGLKQVVDDMIVPMFRGVTIPQFFVIAAVAGVGEEMLFRGLLQGGLEHLLKARMDATTAAWTALLVASAIFGLMHPITRMYALLCFLMGLYMGGIWMLVPPRNLLAPIIIHGLYDFVALVYLVRWAGNRAVRVAE